MAIVPSLIALGFSALPYDVPEVVQKMWAFSFYEPAVVEDGMFGPDLYQRFLSATAWADGFSPYSESVPEKYLYRGKNVPFYPPVTYWMFSKLVPLGYRTVFLLHTAAKIMMFLAVVSWVLWVARAKQLILPTEFAIICCIFLSPPAKSEILQGQFEYFVAAAYTLVFALLFYRPRAWVPVAGFLASLKLSSFTFIGPFSLVALVSCRRRSAGLLGVLAVMLGILVLFFPYLMDFSRHIIAHEFIRTPLYSDRVPSGISFTSILPYYVGKGIIFASTAVVLVVFLCIRDAHQRTEAFLAASFPFAVMVMLEGAGFGLRAWTYKGVTMLALLPGLYLWMRADLVPAWFQRCMAGLFTVLVAILLNLYPLRPLVLLGDPSNMVWVYLVASGMFFVLTLMTVRFGLNGSSSQSSTL